ncbi:hypothetical protein NQZ79_g4510 [Umbelopsis isabellina]|nr:hypothetical protein NQZ79_g4510 [Umbelopsis isabellina]
MWYAKTYNPIQVGSIDGTDTEAHDAAIVRAINSTYKPPKDITTDPLKTLFVGRLDQDTTEGTLYCAKPVIYHRSIKLISATEKLRAVFGEYGSISSVKVMYNFVTGTSLGYAFVTFERTRSAEDAYRRAHGVYIDGRRILVDYERSRVMQNWKPRRLGGGFSGKKESGQLRFGARDRPFRDPINVGRREQLVEISYERKYEDNWRDHLLRQPQKTQIKDVRERSPTRHSYRHEPSSGKRHRSSQSHGDQRRSPSPYRKRRR